jgi:hypothetical protein
MNKLLHGFAGAALLCGIDGAISCGLFYTGFYMLGPMLRGTRMSCACAVVGSTTLVSLGSDSSFSGATVTLPIRFNPNSWFRFDHDCFPVHN